MRNLYRVRHPACPELFVWNLTPGPDFVGAVGRVASFTLAFAEVREGMTLEDAEWLAKQCGGSIEKVPDRQDPGGDADA